MSVDKYDDLELALYNKITQFESDEIKRKKIVDVVFYAMEAVAEKLIGAPKLQHQLTDCQAKLAAANEKAAIRYSEVLNLDADKGKLQAEIEQYAIREEELLRQHAIDSRKMLSRLRNYFTKL